MYKTGDILDGYQLLAECGAGAYGTVWLAENSITGRRVTIKIVPLRGRNGTHELAGIQQYQTICPHTNLLQIYHVAKNDDFLWYTMDAADPLETGPYTPDTLTNRLRRQKRLAADDARSMLVDLRENLDTLHRLGVLHRDVKPDNVLWINGHAVLGDIGLVMGKNPTALAGTPEYLPSEVLAGLREYRPSDDFYSLGCVLYCALTGLPIEKYPAWPRDLTLTGQGDLIQQYNHWINDSGSQAKSSEKDSAPPRKIKYKISGKWLAAIGITAGIAGMVALELWVAERLPQKEGMQSHMPKRSVPVPLPDIPNKKPQSATTALPQSAPEIKQSSDVVSSGQPIESDMRQEQALDVWRHRYLTLKQNCPDSGKADLIAVQYNTETNAPQELISKEAWYPELLEQILSRPVTEDEQRKIRNQLLLNGQADTSENIRPVLERLRSREIELAAHKKYIQKPEVAILREYHENSIRWSNDTRDFEYHLFAPVDISSHEQWQFLERAKVLFPAMERLAFRRAELIASMEKLPLKK